MKAPVEILALQTLESLPAVVLRVDREATITFVTPYAERFFDLSGTQLLGQPCKKIVKTTDTDVDSCPLAECRATRQPVSAETTLDLGRAQVPVRYSCVPVGDTEDVILFFEDISELKEQQEGITATTNTLTNVVLELTWMLQEIDEQTSSISSKTSGMAHAAATMSGNMSQAAGSAKESQENIDAVAAATEEMTVTISEIAKNTHQARGMAQNAVSSVGRSSDQVAELGEAAEEIGKVIDSIADIAEQTKLLSLNAAIAAAKAGNAGRSFGVVAGQIRELAKQTNTATDEIGERIEAIQKQTKATVCNIGDVSTIINEVSTFVSTIAAAVEEQHITTSEIAKNISQANGGINALADNVVECADLSQSVAKDIASANDDIGEVKSSISTMSASGDHLEETKTLLQQLVSRFSR